MRFSFTALSFVLLLAGETLARNILPRDGKNPALSALIAKRQTNRGQIRIRGQVKRAHTELHVERAADDEFITEVLAEREQMEKRSAYPKCKKSSARTGYAHYPGWKLAGDELSGAIPVSPESACIQACNKYGGACSGVSFDSARSQCYLKGTRTTSWSFSAGVKGDGTDLIGGCAMWANIVPAAMNAVCCRD